MDMIINHEELETLYGLPLSQQLVYLRGIRPYMDCKTGLSGVKRGISYQSIAEQLHVEPHQGIKAERFSRAQVRRAVESLERAGLIENHSKGMKLILKCLLASRSYSVQNKGVTKPSQQAVIESTPHSPFAAGDFDENNTKPVTANTSKADTPQNSNYLFLLSAFEQFWGAYPEKVDQKQTWLVFKAINPDETLFRKFMHALHAQVEHAQKLKAQGLWTPNWKYPANWLNHRCWEDAINTEKLKEPRHATRRQTNHPQQARDPFEFEEDAGESNVYPFERRQGGEAY